MADDLDNPGVRVPRLLFTCLPYSLGCIWTEGRTSQSCRAG
jgi:hypothetical protein